MMDNIVYYNYTNPLHETAFSSIKTVARFYRKDLSLTRIKAILRQHPVYNQKRREKKTKTFVPIYAYFRLELLQIDLCEVQYMARYNKGIRYLLMIYDTASKKSWVIPCKNKTSLIISEKLDTFLKNLDGNVKKILMDRGREFTASITQSVFKKYNIICIHPAPGRHAYGVERFNQTFQNILYKYLSSQNTKKYFHHLDNLTEIYNSRRHRVIKMSPNEAYLKENRTRLATTLFYHYGKTVLVGKKKQKKSEFFIGDSVKLKLERKTFTRGYHDHFGKEVYKIKHIDLSKFIPLYTLISNENKTLPTKYYEEDLQHLGNLKLQNLKKIPKFTILQQRKNKLNEIEVLVKWDNIDQYYNTWTPKSLLKQ